MLIDDFITYLTVERRNSEHTIVAYRGDLEEFFQFLALKSLPEVNEISYQNIRGWIVSLANDKVSNRSINRKLSSLRTYFKWAKSNGLIDIDPMLRIKGPKQEKRLPEFVKEEEVSERKLSSLFDESFSGLRDYLLFEMLYQTGIRLSELINIKKNDIEADKIKVLGKRNKERYIPISKSLKSRIENYLSSPQYVESNSNYLFITDKGRKLYPKFVYRKINLYLSLVTNLKKKSPHVLRHSFATHMLNNGASLEVLKEILGHADLNATQIYTHNSFEQISKIYNQAHPRGKNEK